MGQGNTKTRRSNSKTQSSKGEQLKASCDGKVQAGTPLSKRAQPKTSTDHKVQAGTLSSKRGQPKTSTETQTSEGVQSKRSTGTTKTKSSSAETQTSNGVQSKPSFVTAKIKPSIAETQTSEGVQSKRSTGATKTKQSSAETQTSKGAHKKTSIGTTKSKSSSAETQTSNGVQSKPSFGTTIDHKVQPRTPSSRRAQMKNSTGTNIHHKVQAGTPSTKIRQPKTSYVGSTKTKPSSAETQTFTGVQSETSIDTAKTKRSSVETQTSKGVPSRTSIGTDKYHKEQATTQSSEEAQPETFTDFIYCEPPESSDDEMEPTTTAAADIGRLLEKVGLEGKYPNMLGLGYAKRFRKNNESDNFLETFFSKLTSLDPRAVLPESYSYTTTVTWSMRDFLYALYVSCDLLLLQQVTYYLSTCQLAVPLLLPGIHSQSYKLITAGLSKIMKSWNYQGQDSFTMEHLVTFKAIFSVGIVRFGEIPVSKSKIINTMFGRAQGNEQHFHFLTNEEDPYPVTHSKGLVEANWYIPVERRKEQIIQCVTAFFNLRGNAEDFEVQFKFLLKTTNMLIILTGDSKGTKEQIHEILKNDLILLEEKIMFVCLNEFEQGLQCSFQRRGMSSTNYSLPMDCFLPLGIELCKSISLEMTKAHTPKLQAITGLETGNLGIERDEDEPFCKQGKQQAKKIFDSDTRKLKINEFKDTHLLLQLQKGDKMSGKMEQVSQFLIENFSHSNYPPLIYFISYMKHHLHFILHNSLRSIYSEVKRIEALSTQFFAREDDWRSLIIGAARETMGIEHLLRELVLANINSEDRNVELEKLAQVACAMLLNGMPLEIFNGENSRIEFKWLTAICQSHRELLEGRIFVISVIGMQSSGKSTLLNSLFSLEFGACSGRCTRGLFMQIVKLEERFSEEVKFDYILVIDTEGLMSPEKQEWQNNVTDAKIVTLAMCISDLTLLNVFGEMMDPYMTRMIQSAVHSLMRMKRKGGSFNFRLVQQGISDATAVQNNRTGRYSIVRTLDSVTKTAAIYENVQGCSKFSDLFNFSSFEDISFIPCLRLSSSSPPNYSYSTAVQQLRHEICNQFRKNTGQRKQTFSTFISNLETVYNWLNSAQIVTDFRKIMQNMEYLELRLTYNKLISDMRQSTLMFHLDAITDQGNEGLSETVKVLETRKLIHDYIDQFRFEHTNDLEAILSYKRHLKTNLDSIATQLNSTVKQTGTMHLNEANEIISSEFEKGWSKKVKLEVLTYILEYYNSQKHSKKNLNLVRKRLHQACEDYYERNCEKIHHAILSDIIKQTDDMVYFKNFGSHAIPKLPRELSDLATSIVEKIKKKFPRLKSTMTVSTHLRGALLDIMGSASLNVNGLEATLVISGVCSKLSFELRKRGEETRSIFEQAKIQYARLETIEHIAAIAFYDCILQNCVSHLLRTLNSEIVLEMRKNTILTDREYVIASILFDIGQRESFSDMLAFMRVPYIFIEHWINKKIANWYKFDEINSKIKTRLRHFTKDLKSILLCMENDLKCPFTWGTLCDTFLANCSRHVGFRDIVFVTANCQHKLKFQRFKDHFLQLLETRMTSAVEAELNLPEENNNYKIIELLCNMPKPPASQILEHLGNCWKRCPYCCALCHNQEINHETHYARVHYPIALSGFQERYSKDDICLSSSVCQQLPAAPQQIVGGVQSTEAISNLSSSDEWVADSSISLSNYWKRMLAHFSEKLHAKYNIRNISFPEVWGKINKDKAQEELAREYEAYILL